MRRVCRTVVAIAAAFTLAGSAFAQTVPVERLTSREPGRPNAYIVDAGTDAVVVDAMGLVSEGRAIAKHVEDSGKGVAGILVTTPHPDHVGGLAVLEDLTQAQIYASSDTAVELAADTRGLFDIARASAPADTGTVPMVGAVVKDGDRIALGELTFEAKVFGPSAAAGTTVYAVVDRDVVFVGDLLTPGMMPFLLEKRTGDWFEQLDELEAAFPADAIAYPGHGAPGPLGPMIAAQRDYIATLRGLVETAAADGPLGRDERDGVAAEMAKRFPDRKAVLGLPQLAARNVVAVARELAGDRPAPPLATLGD